MTQHRVVELRRLLDTLGRALPASNVEARDPRAEPSAEVAWLGTLIEVLSACRIDSHWERVAVHCEHPECNGAVAMRRIGDACEWFCAACTRSGAVVGWRGSVWDLTALEESDATDRSDAFVFTRLGELEAVRRCQLPRELRLMLAMAQARADYVVLPGAEDELSELTTELERQVRALGESDRRLVERFLARLDAALLQSEARVDEPPTVH